MDLKQVFYRLVKVWAPSGFEEPMIVKLKEELAPHRDQLCRDCQRRWTANPLRILDCKVPRCRALVEQTTPIADVVNEDARAHVEKVAAGLAELEIPVRRAPRLVRGLDYYLRTVFEVVSPELGEETVICGGGRYDRLIGDLGGAQVPGIGFAIGEDRLVEVLPESFRRRALKKPMVAVLPLGHAAISAALNLTRRLVFCGVVAPAEVSGRSLKAGLKWASKIDARAAVILGERELADGTAIVRDLGRGEQESVALEDVPDRIQQMFEGDRQD